MRLRFRRVSQRNAAVGIGLISSYKKHFLVAPPPRAFRLKVFPSVPGCCETQHNEHGVKSFRHLQLIPVPPAARAF